MYQNPKGKEFATKTAAIRYYRAAGKSDEDIASLSGLALRNVQGSNKSDEAKNITVAMIDAKSGLLTEAVDKAKARDAKKAAAVKAKADKTNSKNEQAAGAAKKTPEKASAKKKVAKKKAKAK